MAQDSLETDIVGVNAERKAPLDAELDARLDALLAAQSQPKAAPAASPQQAVVGVPATLTPQSSSPSVMKETTRMVGGAIRDAAQNTLDLSTDISNWTRENLLGLRATQGFKLPEIAENQTTVGKVGRSLIQFVVPFMGYAKALKGAGVVNNVVRGMAAGAVADATAFDPHEKRLSNMVMEMSDSNPVMGKAMFDYLSAHPEDTNAEGRFKNAVEGLGLGVAVEGVFKGIRMVKHHYFTKGEDPAEAVRKAAEAAKKEADDAAKKAEDTRLQAEADRTNEVLGIVERTKQNAKEMPLRDQIDLITGARKTTPKKSAEDMEAALKEREGAEQSAVKSFETAQVAKRIDAATGVSRQSDTAQKRADVEAAVADETPTERFNRIGTDVSTGKSHRAVWDDQEGSIVFTKEPTKPGELPLNQRVQTALGKAPHERTAQDLVILRAYRQLQDSAFPGLAKAGDSAPRATNGQPLATNGDDLAEAIRQKELEIVKNVGKKQHSGLTDPSVLAQMAAAPAGGAAVGAASGDEDDDFATMLTLAGVGALAAWGIKVKVGKNAKVLTPAQREVITNPHPAVKSLAREEVAGIAPREVLAGIPKAAPTIKAAKVTEMVNLARTGDYKGVAAALKESDFNFDRIDTPEDVKQMVDSFSSVFEKETSLAAHGTQSFDQTKELAEELGAGTATMKQMYEGTNNMAARVLAHRSLLTASAEKVTSLAGLARAGDADAILALRKQVALHASIQAQMKGVQTEIARALSSFRITAKSIDLSINERNDLIEAMGGHKLNVEFAQKLADISDPKKLHAVIRRGAMARTKDAMFEAWINGLLSSPATHTVNMVGNTLTALASVAERGTAAAIGKVLRTGGDSIQAGEVKAQLFGMVEGLKDAVSITAEGMTAIRKAAGQAATGNLKGASSTLNDNIQEFGGAWEAAATNAPVLDNAAFSTMEHGARGEALTASQFDLDPNSIIGGFVDGMGALVRLPGRALMTSDELFKTIHYRGELKAQAYRDGRTKGLSGDELFAHIARLVEDPTPELAAQALNAARQGTFTSPLGSMGASGQHYLNQVPGARYVMPFVRTPVNIMKYVGVRTPGLNLLAESVRNEFKAGGVRRDVMLAKTALGGSLYALGATLAAEGVITGGGEKDQSAERLGGIQPYSVKVGNTYYAYNRLDPFGMFLGLAADMSDISGHIGTDKADEMASVAALAISRNLVSKQYLSGIVEFLDTVNSGSETRWQSFIKKFSSTFVPFSALSGAVRREVDPEVKEAWTVMDAVKSKLPGFSKDVPPLVNIFGEDVHYKGGLGPDIASPIYTSEATTDPAASEIARLNIDLKHPPRAIQAISGGPGIDLNHQQYHKYMKLIGLGDKGNNGFKQEMLKLVQSSRYQNLPEDPDNNLYVEAKEKTIKLLYDAHKKRATMQLIQGDPQLQAAFKQNLRNAGNALTGKPVLKLQ